MVKITDLRIGNLLIVNASIEEVTHLKPNLIVFDNSNQEKKAIRLKDVLPIKITPEILLSAGFEKHELESGEPLWHDRNISTNNEFDFPGLFVRKDKYYLLGRTNPETKYFHQLQNLYQALTDRELILALDMSVTIYELGQGGLKKTSFDKTSDID